jgi:hypothetical protein
MIFVGPDTSHVPIQCSPLSQEIQFECPENTMARSIVFTCRSLRLMIDVIKQSKTVRMTWIRCVHNFPFIIYSIKSKEKLKLIAERGV